jgi:hypothetical protein
MTQILASLGESNPALLLTASLIAPSVILFSIIFVAHKLTRAKWGGHWDVV